MTQDSLFSSDLILHWFVVLRACLSSRSSRRNHINGVGDRTAYNAASSCPCQWLKENTSWCLYALLCQHCNNPRHFSEQTLMWSIRWDGSRPWWLSRLGAYVPAHRSVGTLLRRWQCSWCLMFLQGGVASVAWYCAKECAAQGGSQC